MALAVWIVSHIADDGKSYWFEGVQLLAVYLIIAILLFFLPESKRGFGQSTPPQAAGRAAASAP